MPRPPQLPARALGTAELLPAASVTTVATGLEAPAGVAALRDGTLAVSEPRLQQVFAVDPRTGAISPLAGQSGVIGRADGASVPAAQAKLYKPTGIVELADGRIAFSDSANHVVRAIDRAAGKVTILAGGMASAGVADGAASTARFNWPMGLATDAGGNLYVADTANGRVRKIAPGGTVSTLAGGGATDLLPGDPAVPATSAALFYPTGVAATADGSTVYVLATYRVYAVSGGTIRALAGKDEGFADGPGASARLASAGGAALAGGNVYVADGPSYRLRAMSTADGHVRTVAGGWQSARVDGAGSSARFALPAGVAAAADGTLYVTDAAAGAVRAVRP
jgi:DNA-binding beta-propeller fold protein YncE